MGALVRDGPLDIHELRAIADDPIAQVHDLLNQLLGHRGAGREADDTLEILGEFVGPVDPVREEVIGPAGPTTATRMDKFTGSLLEHTGLIGMIGKAERGQIAIDAIKAHGAVYLMAVGGAAYLVSKAIREARVVAFEDLGMEAIHEFVVDEMPVTVAVDVNGESVHRTGPAVWREKIAETRSLEVT